MRRCVSGCGATSRHSAGSIPPSPSWEREPPRRMATTSHWSFPPTSPVAASRSSPAAPTASTAPRTARRWRSAARPSRCLAGGADRAYPAGHTELHRPRSRPMGLGVSGGVCAVGATGRRRDGRAADGHGRPMRGTVDAIGAARHDRDAAAGERRKLECDAAPRRDRSRAPRGRRRDGAAERESPRTQRQSGAWLGQHVELRPLRVAAVTRRTRLARPSAGTSRGRPRGAEAATSFVLFELLRPEGRGRRSTVTARRPRRRRLADQ